MKLSGVSTLFSTLSLFLGAAIAAPTPLLEERQAISILSASQIASYSTYTLFASASYCTPSLTLAWNCGPACAKLPGFKPVASGGDGAFVQYWFVGYHPALSSVVVVYQGTDPFKLVPLLTDANVPFVTPEQSLFPGLPGDARAHSGFYDAYKLSQSSVINAVNRASATYGTRKVVVIGHSMGAAIAAISASSMKLRLGAGWTWKVVGYGQPRVGNQAWVHWVDSNLGDLTRINNKDDPVPILPGRFLGYVGSHGEIHIQDNNNWASCPGDDNTSVGCTVTDVGNVFISNIVEPESHKASVTFLAGRAVSPHHIHDEEKELCNEVPSRKCGELMKALSLLCGIITHPQTYPWSPCRPLDFSAAGIRRTLTTAPIHI